MTVVHYEHNYKRPPKKKPQAAKIEVPAVVTITDPQLEKALREELVALEGREQTPARAQSIPQAEEAVMSNLCEADESKWMMQPPSGTHAGIDRELTGAMSACWLILAAFLVNQIVLLIAMACVNEDLESLSRLLAQIAP